MRGVMTIYMEKKYLSQSLGILLQQQDIFVGPYGTNLAKHSVNTTYSKPVKNPPRRLPFAQREIVENEISKMTEKRANKIKVWESWSEIFFIGIHTSTNR